MDRLILFAVVCIAQLGCQTPGARFDPLAFGRQTRISPPPTGVVGAGSNFYDTPTPRPPVDAGAYAWPSANPNSTNRYPGQTGFGGGFTDNSDRRVPSVASSSSFDLGSVADGGDVAGTELTQLRNVDQLPWRDPAQRLSSGGLSNSVNDQFANSAYAGAGGSGYSNGGGSPYGGFSQQPNRLPETGQLQPLVARQMYVTPPVSAPPRIVRAQGQPLSLPPELAAQFQENGVRQASAAAPDRQTGQAGRY